MYIIYIYICIFICVYIYNIHMYIYFSLNRFVEISAAKAHGLIAASGWATRGADLEKLSFLYMFPESPRPLNFRNIA